MDATLSCNNLDREALEALVKTHAVLVKRIGHHLLVRMPMSVALEDLLQVGMMGLLEAAKHYDPSKGASFETYASIRIRGAMLDEVRQNDWVPRSVYRNARQISSAVRTIENRLGRPARDRDIADELNMPLLDFYELLKDSAGSQLQGFEDFGVSEDSFSAEVGLSEPQAKVMHDDLISKLGELIDHLPEAERLVLSLYYEQDLNLKEIGEVLGVSESRVSQIHTQATLRIKARFKG